MFLRNFYNAYARLIMGADNREADATDKDSNYYIKSLNGTHLTYNEFYQYQNPPSIASVKPSCNYGADRVMFGRNSTSVTYDDYEFTPITGLDFGQTKNTPPMYSDGKWVHEMEYTITNNNDYDVVINEVCLVGSTDSIGYADASGSQSKAYIYYRDVLDESITIPVGETIKFVYSCEFSL